MDQWEDCSAVEQRSEVCSGEWVFCGTRVPIRALFENLRDGASVNDFLSGFRGFLDTWWSLYWNTRFLLSGAMPHEGLVRPRRSCPLEKTPETSGADSV